MDCSLVIYWFFNSSDNLENAMDPLFSSGLLLNYSFSTRFETIKLEALFISRELLSVI